MAGESNIGWLGNLTNTFDKFGTYAGPVGKAYTAFKMLKGFKEGGIKGGLSSLMPSFGGFGGFGSSGSKTNAMARQYMDLVNKFDKEFLSPTVENLTKVKRNAAVGFRISGMPESFRSVMSEFEGAGQGLRDMVGRSDFGSIAGRISELSEMSKRVAKGLGGKGTGPSIHIRPVQGNAMTLNAIKSPMAGENQGGFSPVRSTSIKTPISTNITPSRKPLKFKFEEGSPGSIL